MLAFVAVFSTVAPVSVFGEDTALITNVVFTSNTTGGQTGTQGTNGQDGKPGQDGQSGTSGASIVSKKSTATMHVETVSNDQKTVTTYKVQAPETQPSSTTQEATSSHLQKEDISTNSSTVGFTEQSFIGIRQALLSISLMLRNYVNLLF